MQCQRAGGTERGAASAPRLFVRWMPRLDVQAASPALRPQRPATGTHISRPPSHRSCCLRQRTLLASGPACPGSARRRPWKSQIESGRNPSARSLRSAQNRPRFPVPTLLMAASVKCKGYSCVPRAYRVFPPASSSRESQVCDSAPWFEILHSSFPCELHTGTELGGEEAGACRSRVWV